MSFVYPVPTPVFPSLFPGYSKHIKPITAGIVATSVDGAETRITRQAYPLWEFELTFEILRDKTPNVAPDPYFNGYAELQAICGLFLAVGGQYGRFYYDCPEDNSRSGQFIANADGTTSSFVAVRNWGGGSLGHTEPVGGINAGQPWKIYLDGVDDSSNWTVAADKFSFVRSVPPPVGKVITADFYFYYFCRFLEDIQDFEQFYHNLWASRSCKFRSVKAMSDPADAGPAWYIVSGLVAPGIASGYGWFDVSISLDGQVIAAIPISAGDGNNYGQRIYISTDGGGTFAYQNLGTLADGQLSDLRISADGTTIFVSGPHDGSNHIALFVSTNSGASFAQKPFPVTTWTARVNLSIDSTAQKLLIAPDGPQSSGPGITLYISTNQGTSWTAQSPTSNGAHGAQWSAAGCSSDFSTLVAVESWTQTVHFSSNGGSSWATHSLGGVGGGFPFYSTSPTRAVAISSTGTHIYLWLTKSLGGGPVIALVKSSNGGATFIEDATVGGSLTEATGGICCTEDGVFLAACGFDGTHAVFGPLISYDSGASFAPEGQTEQVKTWTAVNCNYSATVSGVIVVVCGTNGTFPGNITASHIWHGAPPP